jgi:hypothetical protein
VIYRVPFSMTAATSAPIPLTLLTGHDPRAPMLSPMAAVRDDRGNGLLAS